MGYSKIVKLGPGKVKIVHQLDQNGEHYAEDVIVDATKAPEGRISYLEEKDGQIGTVSVSFTPASFPPGYTPDVKFPEV